MSVSHGHSTIGGIDGGCGEDKKEIVSHQLGVLTGYGDAHQYISSESIRYPIVTTGIHSKTYIKCSQIHKSIQSDETKSQSENSIHHKIERGKHHI